VKVRITAGLRYEPVVKVQITISAGSYYDMEVMTTFTTGSYIMPHLFLNLKHKHSQKKFITFYIKLNEYKLYIKIIDLDEI
jgi:hypothetical protein